MKYSLIAIFLSTLTFAPSAFAVLDGFGMPVVSPTEKLQGLAIDVEVDLHRLSLRIFEQEQKRLFRAQKELKTVDDLLANLETTIAEMRQKHSRDSYSTSASVTTYIPGEAQAYADQKHWKEMRPKLEAEYDAMKKDFLEKLTLLQDEGLEAVEKRFAGTKLPAANGYIDAYRAQDELGLKNINSIGDDLASKLDQKYVSFGVSAEARTAYRELEKTAASARAKGVALKGKFGKAGLVLGIAGAAVTMYGAASDAQAQEVKSFDLQPSAAPEVERSDVAITSTLDD